jgi:hypothetical protein
MSRHSVVKAIEAFSEGAHSRYAAVPELGDSLRGSPLWQGKYVLESGNASAQFVLEADGGKVVGDELLVEATLVKNGAAMSASCCQDDYLWWRVSRSW